MVKLPKGIRVERIEVTLSQEEDSAGRSGIETQTLDIEVVDAGGGWYPVIKTERWAMDMRDIPTLVKALKDMMALEDKTALEAEGK